MPRWKQFLTACLLAFSSMLFTFYAQSKVNALAIGIKNLYFSLLHPGIYRSNFNEDKIKVSYACKYKCLHSEN